MTDVLLVQTGGTIDKDYPRKTGGYAFEIADAAAVRILEQGRVTIRYETLSACRKDSQELTDEDREQIKELCMKAIQNRILVTHGTDTMIETGMFLNAAAIEQKKIVVLTGAFKPETFKCSDATFNVGLAVGALQSLETPGVYIAMNGKVRLVTSASRDKETGIFH